LEIIPKGKLLFIATLILDTIVTRQLWHKFLFLFLSNFSIKIELYVQIFEISIKNVIYSFKAAGFEPAPY
jgi:hypothetical protein